MCIFDQRVGQQTFQHGDKAKESGIDDVTLSRPVSCDGSFKDLRHLHGFRCVQLILLHDAQSAPEGPLEDRVGIRIGRSQSTGRESGVVVAE